MTRMLLIGMFDSPFVRRVAVTLTCLKMPFEHANWSVGRDFERIRQFSPLGRVPVLVLDDDEPLIESSVILDALDDMAGPARALLPASGRSRRQALHLMALAVGAAEKGQAQVYEKVMRPADKRHPPWVERCRDQMHGALGQLEASCPPADSGAWLLGDRLTQADITVGCIYTFLSEATGMGGEQERYPRLAALVARCESLPEFQATRAPWSAPTV